MYRKAGTLLGQQMQGSQMLQASGQQPWKSGLGWSTPSCRHVSAASAIFSNSARRRHLAIPLDSITQVSLACTATAPLT